MIADPLSGEGADEKGVALTHFLSELCDKTGYDFRDYSLSSIRRRLQRRMELEHFDTLEQLREHIGQDPLRAAQLVQDFSIRVSEMFRNPEFFQALRSEVMPVLRTYPFVRIWQAGCADGQEVYSLAILLRESGLEDRARIYATDFNEKAVRQSRDGVFPIAALDQYEANYLAAGGNRPFAEYYQADAKWARFDPSLKKRIVFAQHNLVSDSSFNEFQLILCRNVLIYFNRRLQARVLNLIHSSLMRLGFLGLGQKESLLFSPLESSYTTIDPREKIYRKT